MTASLTRTTITATEAQRNFGEYFDRAAVQAITIERHKRARVVMVPADEYAALVAHRNRALLKEPLNAFLDARFAEPQALAPECPQDCDEPAKERRPRKRAPAAAAAAEAA